MFRPRALLLLSFAFSSACAASVGVTGFITVPEDGQEQCAMHCATMQMEVGAVVVMANQVGCVCEPRRATADAGDNGAALAGGMAAIVIEEEKRRQQEDAAAR